jgi:hypothetical protein
MHHGCLQTKSEKYARIRRHAPQPTGQSCPTPLRRVITRPRPTSDLLVEAMLQRRNPGADRKYGMHGLGQGSIVAR